MDGRDDDNVNELLSQLNLIQDIEGASHRYKRESLQKLEELYKYSRKASLTRKSIVKIESAIEKLKSQCQRKYSTSDDSCAEIYDLTEEDKKGMRPRKYERSPSRSRYDSAKERKFHKRLHSVFSSVQHSWTETKPKREYGRYSPRSDTISEEGERHYRRQRKDRRSRRCSPCRYYYRSRSRSPFRDTERKYYRRRRDSDERYRRSPSYDYTERRSRSGRRRISSGRSNSHERDRKYGPKCFNDAVVKIEDSSWDEHDSENSSPSCTEVVPAPENHVSSTVVDELRKKIQSTLQNSSNRNKNQSHAVVDSTSTHENNLLGWQGEFELNSEPSNELEIQREDASDNHRQALATESVNVAQDVHRPKIQFTFTKSMKTVTESQVSRAFNENTPDDLADARSELSDLLKTVLDKRNKNDTSNETASEHPPVQEHPPSIDDDSSVDHELIQKIISQAQVHTSSSYEVAVNVPARFDCSAATVKMLENKLSSESQRYTGKTFPKSCATQIVHSNRYSSTDDQSSSSMVNTTTTQVLHSSNSRYLATNVNLPIPSTKFLPVVSSLQKVAPSRQSVNPSKRSKRSPFNSAIDSTDQISHRQPALRKNVVPITYCEYKNQIASRELLGNYRIPKKTTNISGSTALASSTLVMESLSKGREKPVKLVADDYKNRDKHKRPVSQSKTSVVESQSQGSQAYANAFQNDHEDCDTHTRPISISSDSSAVESYCHGTEVPIENDDEDWDDFQRPMSPQSNENATLQSDNHSTENDTASDPVTDASKEANVMETMKEWVKTDEFTAFFELMQHLTQPKNLEKLKGVLSNKNDTTRNVENGEGSSTATPEMTAFDELIVNASNTKQDAHTYKNIDTACNTLRKVMQCQACDKPIGNSLVSHYVNRHPNVEVLTSRLAPEAAESLRSGAETKIHVARPDNVTCYHYTQVCYFCNIYKTCSKKMWIEHMARHTGYYGLRCNHCSKKLSSKPTNTKCAAYNNFDVIPQPQFKKRELLAYVCDLCNYVRFHQHEIQMHLRNEHGDGKKSKKFQELTFLRFPDAKDKFVRKNGTKPYKKRMTVDKFLSTLTDSDAEIDLKDEFGSEEEENEAEDETATSSDDSESECESDWSNMDIQDDEGNETFSENNSDSDFE